MWDLTRMDSKGIYLRNNIAYLLGDLEIFEVDTYRYVFPLCKKFKHKLQQQAYPAYKKGVYPIKWERNKGLIKEILLRSCNRSVLNGL